MDKFTTEYLKIITEANENDALGELNINFDKDLYKDALKKKISYIDPKVGVIYSPKLKISMSCYISADPHREIYDYEKKEKVKLETYTYEELLKFQPSSIEWPWYIENQYHETALNWKGDGKSDHPALFQYAEPGKYTYPVADHNKFGSLDRAKEHFIKVFKEFAEQIHEKSKARKRAQRKAAGWSDEKIADYDEKNY